MQISHDSGLCTVIVTVDGAPEHLAEAAEHASQGLRRFAGFPGFVAGATHRSADGARLVQYLQWRSEADHQACMADPSWADDPSSQRFMAQMQAGQIAVDVRVYTVAAQAEGE